MTQYSIKDVHHVAIESATHFNAFDGNCGLFAEGLRRVLLKRDIQAGFIFVKNDVDYGICHVALKVFGHIIDGSGLITEQTLCDFACTPKNKKKTVHLHDIGPEQTTDAVVNMVLRETAGKINIQEVVRSIETEAERFGWFAKGEKPYNPFSCE